MLIVILGVRLILLAWLVRGLEIINENVRGVRGVLLAINEKLDRIVPAETDDPEADLDDEDV